MIDEFSIRRQEPLTSIHQRHLSFLKAHLAGEKVDGGQLWLSVGYFKYGNGKIFFEREKPIPEKDWEKLLSATGR